MNTWVALLRGINVGGNNILPMKDLRSLLDAQGFIDVKTYIQSGNIVFRSGSDDQSGLTRQIEDLIEQGFGFRPPVLLLSQETLNAAVSANPYPDGDPKTVQFCFLFAPAPGTDMDPLHELAVPSEEFTLTDSVFYLHAPDGIGRSKLVAKMAQHIPTEMTVRNLRTVLKLQELANT
ncbi:MAG: DUF1697 domain-containing protein [Kordiimonadaceae bacterium]|nr:DUF1697 domain-containing protein [Kordiimonadaceae bacterium]MBO6569664.1 DUF1697 domain-containing protein [Kordiimonadaceae bacterium]MBO6966199.1 DUF1697 domain-containing protein [Kordiimonadaceae bacterium]